MAAQDIPRTRDLLSGPLVLQDESQWETRLLVLPAGPVWFFPCNPN